MPEIVGGRFQSRRSRPATRHSTSPGVLAQGDAKGRPIEVRLSGYDELFATDANADRGKRAGENAVTAGTQESWGRATVVHPGS